MIAVSLFDRRTQFAHAAAENIERELFLVCFFRTAGARQIILDRIELPRELSKQVLGKVAQTAPPNLQIVFDGTVRRGLHNTGSLHRVVLHGVPKSSGRLFVFDDRLLRACRAVDAERRPAGRG
jgi:hypothetical protein